MSTIWAYAKRKKTWKIVSAAVAALIILLSIVGLVSPALGYLTAAVSFVFSFRAGCKLLRKWFKRWRSHHSMVDYKEDPRVVDKLLPGEKVIVATPEHPVAIMMSIFTFATPIAMFGGGIFCAILAARSGNHDWHQLFFTGVVLGFMGRILYRVLVWRTDLLVLTNKRLYTVAGFFSREREAIRLRSIAGISTRVSMVSFGFAWLGIIDKPIGYVKATGIGTIFERFRHTPDIEDFTRQLEIAQDQAAH